MDFTAVQLTYFRFEKTDDLWYVLKEEGDTKNIFDEVAAQKMQSVGRYLKEF